MQARIAPEGEAEVAERLKALRLEAGLTIDMLAGQAGVSRAMISRIERGEASPTAVLLGRLANALGLTLSDFFASPRDEGPIARAAERPFWQDPASGYLRRAVAPRGFPADIVEVRLPAGASLRYDNAVPLPLEQAVWLLEGELAMEAGGAAHTLAAGDCLRMRLDGPTRFTNPGRREARYAVVLLRGGR